MLKNFSSLSDDWIACLVDIDQAAGEGWIVWEGDFGTYLEPGELQPGYALAVPLPYDAENPKTVDTQYWLQLLWHDPEYFDLNIKWEYCDPSFIAWCDWVNKQWFEAGFCDAVSIPPLWSDDL